MAQDAIILYENGKAIGGEGHPTDADDITFDNTGTDLVSEEVESAIKEVNAKTSGLMKLSLLWQNPSPGAGFSGQSVQMSSTDYDMLLFIAYNNTSQTYQTSTIINSNYGVFSNPITTSNTNLSTRERAFSISGTTVTFGDCLTQNQGSSASVNNNSLIPYQIYGIKVI